MPIEILKESEVKEEPKLLQYGTFNVVEIEGKAYYADHTSKKKQYVRAPERDYLIREKG